MVAPSMVVGRTVRPCNDDIVYTRYLTDEEVRKAYGIIDTNLATLEAYADVYAEGDTTITVNDAEATQIDGELNVFQVDQVVGTDGGFLTVYNAISGSIVDCKFLLTVVRKEIKLRNKGCKVELNKFIVELC